MPDYSKCCVYKLCCKDPTVESIYIGSTTHVNKRKCDHKKRCLNPNDKEYNSYKYQFIRDNGGWDNWQLIVLEQFSCESKMQKEKKERSYVETLKPTLNTNIPANYQTGDVYNAQEYKREHRKHNIDSIRQKKKEYYEQHKEAIQEYQTQHKERIQEYRKDYCKRYIECPCCKENVLIVNRSRHNRSKKHINNQTSSSSSSSSNEEA